MEVPRHIVLRFLYGPVYIFQGLIVHAKVEVQYCPVVVHMCVLACPQPPLNQLQNPDKTLSIDGIFEVLLIHDDSHVEEGLGPKDEGCCFLEQLQRFLPATFVVLEYSLAYADIV